jgi:exopolysaccharide biosynthesis predicted pyruvyltransferase EpsI
MKSLTQILGDTLEPVCAPGNYAVIDYPNYRNPGDCTIWLGTRAFLEKIYRAPPVYTSTIKHFNSGQCRRLLGNGTVFLVGGGNLGALYAKHNQRRLDVIRSLPECPVVLLPLSIAGLTGSGGKETIRVIGEHKNLTMFVRDEMSQSELSNLLQRPIQLCPDLSHAYPCDPLPLVEGTTYLLRQDTEKVLRDNIDEQSKIRSWDWPDLPGLNIWNRAGKLLNGVPHYDTRQHFQELVARKKVDAALRPLMATGTVVTDRLHGLILARALGRKVVIIDNSTGKVASYWKTWRAHFPNVVFAENLSEAILLSKA